MRRAIAAAEVGDEQRGLDPTVNALQERVAELLGHDAALFLPTGTLCNEISIRLHIRPGGDEVYLHRSSHPIVAEAGGPAAFSGAMVHPLEGPPGVVRADALRAPARAGCSAPMRSRPRSGLQGIATRPVPGWSRSSRRRTSPAGTSGRSSSC